MRSEPSGLSVDVLVGIDGSPQSLAAATLAIRLLDGRIGRLTLAAVVTYEAGRVMESEDRRNAERILDEAASMIGPRVAPQFDTAVLTGRPDEALALYAREGGYHLVAVGRRGRGASKLLMGSVARRLCEDATLPVLTAPESPEH